MVRMFPSRIVRGREEQNEANTTISYNGHVYLVKAREHVPSGKSFQLLSRLHQKAPVRHRDLSPPAYMHSSKETTAAANNPRMCLPTLTPSWLKEAPGLSR